MDYQQYNGDPNFSNDWDEKPPMFRRSGMETAAFVLSVCSLMLTSFFPLTLSLIGLSILFALLSKGAQMKTGRLARLSIVISVLSLTVGTVSTASFVYRNWDTLKKTFDQAVERAYEILENPDAYEDPWSYRNPDSSTPSPYSDFYGDSNTYEDLIEEIYGGPSYQMPSPVSPRSFPQAPDDIV